MMNREPGVYSKMPRLVYIGRRPTVRVIGCRFSNSGLLSCDVAGNSLSPFSILFHPVAVCTSYESELFSLSAPSCRSTVEVPQHTEAFAAVCINKLVNVWMVSPQTTSIENCFQIAMNNNESMGMSGRREAPVCMCVCVCVRHQPCLPHCLQPLWSSFAPEVVGFLHRKEL